MGHHARVIGVALALTTTLPAAAEPRPALDDFYDRTRTRDDGFGDCLGYCDGHWLAAFLIGAQSANPSTDPIAPHVASGMRLGLDLGVRGRFANIARTKLWADILRIHDTGTWITELAWQTTAFAILGGQHPGDGGVHVSADATLAQRTELEPSDIAELQHSPYRMIDVETEAAPVGGMVDKDAFAAFPIGLASRLRWDDRGMRLERRTAISGAIALRGFPNGLRHHLQLDVLRIKHTDWDVLGGTASAWTVSTGYQRLSPDLAGVELWILGGYEWTTGGRRGPVVQVGAEIKLAAPHGVLELGPSFEEHLELDPRTAMFTRVYQARLYAHHHWGRVRYGLAYEAVALEHLGRLHAITPELAIAVHGVELGLRYRITWLHDDRLPSAPGDRFHLTLDWLF